MTVPFLVPGAAYKKLQCDPYLHILHPERDAQQRRLAEAGIATSVHYAISPHRYHAYALYGLAALSGPNAESSKHADL